MYDLKLFLISHFLVFVVSKLSDSLRFSVLKCPVVVVEGEAGEEKESTQVQVSCKAGLLCVGKPFDAWDGGGRRTGGFFSLL